MQISLFGIKISLALAGLAGLSASRVGRWLVPYRHTEFAITQSRFSCLHPPTMGFKQPFSKIENK